MSRFVPQFRSPFSRPLILTMVCATLSFASHTLRAAGLNDTGQTNCYGSDGTAVSCGTAGQDGRYGRDAAATAGLLPKTGAGAAGFDYTKVANNGSDLAAAALLGSSATAWACTRDNLTGLVWEMKTATAGDLRYSGYFYSWYSTAANNGGNAGGLGNDSCNGTLAAFSNQCNTTNYVAAINAAGLCAHSDWRLPTLKELLSLLNAGATHPAIDATYFPNTQPTAYWSSTTYAPSVAAAWSVDFSDAYVSGGGKVGGNYIRLVRGP